MSFKITVTADDAQAEKWEEEIEEEYENKTEYARQMIDAGRRELGLEGTHDTGEDSGNDDEEDSPSVPNLEYRVRRQLDEETIKTSSEIVEGIVEDLEDDVEDVLNDLVVSGSARFEGGGFVLTEE